MDKKEAEELKSKLFNKRDRNSNRTRNKWKYRINRIK